MMYAFFARLNARDNEFNFDSQRIRNAKEKGETKTNDTDSDSICHNVKPFGNGSFKQFSKNEKVDINKRTL